MIDGIPAGKKYVSVFKDVSRFEGPVRAPKVLELRNVRDLYVCYLYRGQGLERVEVYGDANDFGQFKYVPDTVKEMTWEGKEPGRWQGEFAYRNR
ncbi:MAG: hypothetical protein R6U98_06840 [Pirellulaceae bacterium]